MILSISEILKNASAITDEFHRADFLKKNWSPALQTVIAYAYRDDIKWLLPESNPPFKKNVLVDQEGVLYHEYRKLYLFVEGGNPNLKNTRREQLFIQLLENAAPEDADLLLHVKNKHLPYPGVTKDFINKYWPGLLG